MGMLGRVLALWVFLLGMLPAGAPDLDGQWLFEASTGDGSLTASLSLESLEAEESALNVQLSIDGHRLVGKAVLTGSEFEVHLRHAVEPGSAEHSSWLILNGRRVGEQLRGTWDDGEHQGEWVGTRR